MKVTAEEILVTQKKSYAQQNLATINELSTKFKEIQRQVAYAALLVGEMAKMGQQMGDADTASDFKRASELLQEALALVSSDGQGAGIGQPGSGF